MSKLTGVVVGYSDSGLLNQVCDRVFRVDSFKDDIDDHLEQLIKESDVVQFMGGADINPMWYGERAQLGTHFNHEQDVFEVAVHNIARQGGKIITGICRGAQLICALNGGKLIQHVTFHQNGRHPMHISNGEILEVNSLHHQMCLPPPHAQVLGWAPNIARNIPIGTTETEAYFIPATWSFGVQYHPEFMNTDEPARIWYLKQLKQIINMKENNHAPETFVPVSSAA